SHKNALVQLDNNMTMITTQEGNVDLAEQVLANTRSNYQHGLATLNDILDAERDLTEAKNNLTKAKLDYKLAEINLLKSQGKLRTLNENNKKNEKEHHHYHTGSFRNWRCLFPDPSE